METWFLVLILTTPGQPSEHYVTLHAPSKATCEVILDYFVHAVAHKDEYDEPGIPMAVVEKNCQNGEDA